MKIDHIIRILVVGAGQMGSQIAMQAGLHGYAMTLNDLSRDIVKKGMKGNRAQLDKRVVKGQMTQAQMDAAVGRLRPEPDLEKAARDADFVTEAIVERLEPKRECFAEGRTTGVPGEIRSVLIAVTTGPQKPGTGAVTMATPVRFRNR